MKGLKNHPYPLLLENKFVALNCIGTKNRMRETK